MSIWTDTEEDEIEYGETGGVFLCEFTDELFFVGVGQFFEVVEEGCIDCVDVFGWDRGVAEEFLRCKTVIGVFVVERDAALVGVEDLPVSAIRVQTIPDYSKIPKSSRSANRKCTIEEGVSPE